MHQPGEVPDVGGRAVSRDSGDVAVRTPERGQLLHVVRRR